MKTMLFVYGTLRRGHSNNRLLRSLAGFHDVVPARFVQEDEAPGCWHGYPMVIKPDHPSAAQGHRLRGAYAPVGVRDTEVGWVPGEVFEVTDERMLEAIDRLEGHPRHWCRTPVVLRSGLAAEIYYWQVYEPEPRR